MTTYYFNKIVDLSFEDAIERVTEELKKEGFGILTEIDVAATLETKIGVERKPYKILGACNPSLAHRALQSDLGVGLLLPCNVLVYAVDGGSVVSIFDPEVGVTAMGVSGFEPIAQEAKALLSEVLAQL